MIMEKIISLLKFGLPFAFVVKGEEPKNSNEKIKRLFGLAFEFEDPYYFKDETEPVTKEFIDNLKLENEFKEFKFDIQKWEDIEEAVEKIHDSEAKFILIDAGDYTPILQFFIFNDDANITTIHCKL